MNLITKPSAPEVKVVSTPDAIGPYVADWDDLALHAAEPNLFLESWALIPAWKHLAGKQEVSMVLVYAPMDRRSGAQQMLIGVFPMALHQRDETLRIATAALWRHTHCPLGTPLVRAGCEREALAAFLTWLDQQPSPGHVLSMELIGGDGPFFAGLQHVVAAQKRGSFYFNEFSRGVFRPMTDADEYYQTAFSSQRRRDIRKKMNNLTKLGRVDAVEIKPGDELDTWLDAFFGLEAAGWKGKINSAISCSETDVRFYKELSRNAHSRGRLQMLMLRLDEKPVAMQYNLVSPQGAFALKIAFDETYARYSPGMLLTVEAFRIFHGHPNVPWMDSCPSAPVNLVREDLWSDKRLVLNVFVSMNDSFGKFVIRLLPAARRLARAARSFRRRVKGA